MRKTKRLLAFTIIAACLCAAFGSCAGEEHVTEPEQSLAPAPSAPESEEPSTPTPTPEAEPEPSPNPVPSESPSPRPVAPSVSREPVERFPSSISIPAIGLREEKIVALGLDKNGAMATTNGPDGVSWYKHGPMPGEPGNALLAGHNYWGAAEGSFVNLFKLELGDFVTIAFTDGARREFIVTDVDTYLVADAPSSVMSQKGETRTTLISCAGIKTTSGYSHRCVILLRRYYPSPPGYEWATPY